MEENLLIVISAPSGAGKTTICKKLLKTSSNMVFSISMTTRSPRDNEVDGRDYFFVSNDEFKDGIEKNKFVEWAKVYDDYYGTPKKFIDEALMAGIDVLLDIDVQGAMNIKKIYKDKAVLVFIIPPFIENLKERLLHRMTDDIEEIEKRLSFARLELKHIYKYDYCLINDDIGTTVGKLKSIITAEKNKVNRINPEILKKLEIEKDA